MIIHPEYIIKAKNYNIIPKLKGKYAEYYLNRYNTQNISDIIYNSDIYKTTEDYVLYCDNYKFNKSDNVYYEDVDKAIKFLNCTDCLKLTNIIFSNKESIKVLYVDNRYVDSKRDKIVDNDLELNVSKKINEILEYHTRYFYEKYKDCFGKEYHKLTNLNNLKNIISERIVFMKEHQKKDPNIILLPANIAEEFYSINSSPYIKDIKKKINNIKVFSNPHSSDIHLYYSPYLDSVLKNEIKPCIVFYTYALYCEEKIENSFTHKFDLVEIGYNFSNNIHKIEIDENSINRNRKIKINE